MGRRKQGSDQTTLLSAVLAGPRGSFSDGPRGSTFSLPSSGVGRPFFQHKRATQRAPCPSTPRVLPKIVPSQAKEDPIRSSPLALPAAGRFVGTDQSFILSLSLLASPRSGPQFMTCPHFQTLSALSLGVVVVYESLFPNNGLVKIYATQNRKVSESRRIHNTRRSSFVK